MNRKRLLSIEHPISSPLLKTSPIPLTQTKYIVISLPYSTSDLTPNYINSSFSSSKRPFSIPKTSYIVTKQRHTPIQLYIMLYALNIQMISVPIPKALLQWHLKLKAYRQTAGCNPCNRLYYCFLMHFKAFETMLWMSRPSAIGQLWNYSYDHPVINRPILVQTIHVVTSSPPVSHPGYYLTPYIKYFGYTPKRPYSSYTSNKVSIYPRLPGFLSPIQSQTKSIVIPPPKTSPIHLTQTKYIVTPPPQF